MRIPLSAALTPALLAVASCGADADPGLGLPPGTATAVGGLPLLQHDFGVVPHGESRAHDFVLDLRTALGTGWYAPGAQSDCSCSRTELWLRGQDGSLRQIETFQPESAPKEGETLLVRAILETGKREAVDTAPIDSKISVVLQRVDARDASNRQVWPLGIRFQIDCPVRVRPASTIDFERVPHAKPRSLTLTLSSDLPSRTVRFSSPACEDPRVTAVVEPQVGFSLLRATLSPNPGDQGNLRTILSVATDLDSGYVLRIPVIAAFVEDLEAMPSAKVAIRDDLRRPQSEERAKSQYVLVTDHDESRPEQFLVAAIVDAKGADASRSWAVHFEPVAGNPRSRRMHVRWIGSGVEEFRGEVVLCKDIAKGPRMPIELVAFHVKNP